MDAVFIPVGGDDFELCHPRRDEDFDAFSALDGTPRASRWTPVEMTLIQRDGGRSLAPSDAPWLGSHALIFRPSVVEALADLLTDYGELLPLAGVDLQLFNPTRVIDALDEDRSELVRFDEGHIMDIETYVFRPEALEGVDVFKLPNLGLCPTFVSERFTRRWAEAGLRGLSFEQIWAR